MSSARRALLSVVSVVVVLGAGAPPAFARSRPAAVTASTTHATAVHPQAAPAEFQSFGYWLVASDGGIFSGGDATFHGSTGALSLHRPIVGLARTASGAGYWLTASDGGIFSFGDAVFHGSTGAMHLNRPIVGIASTPSGDGYWLVASDGGIFSFGDAVFHGSTGAMHLNSPIVGISASLSGAGYRMVASDGGVFSFGDAEFDGSAGAMHLAQPIVGMAATASGHGYWFVASDGGVFSFGDAQFFGSAGAMALDHPIVGMVATAPVPAAAKLAFTTEPGDSTGGLALATQPVVTVQDVTGATVSRATAPVTLSLTTAGGATFACTANPKAAVAGVATFSGCAVDLPGNYTLTAHAAGLSSAVSTTVTITVGVGAQLRFSTQPSGAVNGVVLGTQPAVSIRDAGGNLVTGNTSAVTLTLTVPGAATLACTGTTTKTAVAGVATFAGCNVDTAGTYTLTATDGVLTTAVSSSAEITTIAAKLAFTTEPSGTASGSSAFTIQPVVKIQDATGHTIVANTSSVVLTITGGGGSTLACTGTTTKVAVAGVATFAGCNVDHTGTYTLTATDAPLTPAISSSIVIAFGPAAKLAFTTEPAGATGGVLLATQPVVTVQDLGGNTVTSNTTAVTLTITTPAGATLLCTANPKAAVAGVVTFGGCKIDLVGSYTLTAADGSLTTAVSSSVAITLGSAAKLAFTSEPGPSTGGVAFVAQPVVTVQDLGGNTATSNVSSVTLTITTPAGATLACTANPKAAAAGVVTFGGCKIDLEGTYTLTATDGVLTSATSGSTTITVGGAVALSFLTQPVGAAPGSNFGTPPMVRVVDLGGNTVTTDGSSVLLALTTPAGATLTCAVNPLAASAGVATFAACHVDLAGTYTITATDGSLTAAVSDSVVIA